jgi:hypothetical protein
MAGLGWLRKLWCGLRYGHDYLRGGSDYLTCRKCGRIRQWNGAAERVDTERLVQQALVIGETLRTFKSENVSLPEGVRLLGIRAEQVESKRDEARRFGEDAAKRYNDLLARSTEVTCAYCGQTYPAGTPRRGDGALTDHIRTCSHHPMRALESDLAACRARLAEAATERTPHP